MRKIIYLLICGLLTACAAASPVTSVKKSVAETPTVLSHAELRTAFSALPGAVVPAEDPLSVLFPVGTLFARGSVLPMPGGAGLLDNIAELLKKSNLSWQLTVRAASGEGVDYDKGLAASRVKILNTYLTEVGLNARMLSFKAVAEEGAPLEMQLLK